MLNLVVRRETARLLKVNGFSFSFYFPLKSHLVSIYARIPAVVGGIYGAALYK
jgi:hypothetical protein